MSTAPAHALLLLALAASIPAAAADFKTVYQFTGGADGGSPFTALAPAGSALAGLTDFGGAHGAGTIYTIDPRTQRVTTIADLADRPEGETPTPGPVDVQGILYGTTYFGGALGQGEVFSAEISTGKLSVLHSFGQSMDGMAPQSGVIYRDGRLYGTTATGGDSRARSGTVFSIDLASGAEKILYNFGTKTNDAGLPNGLIFSHDALFGTSLQGGASNFGTIFKVDPNTGAEKTVYEFQVGPDGALPEFSLIDHGGLLYGNTRSGGQTENGTLFSFNPQTRVETQLYSFAGDRNGGGPSGAIVYLKGHLYGVTRGGGKGTTKCQSAGAAKGCGTVFSFDLTTRVLKVLYRFSGGADGAGPYGGLFYSGKFLYGTTMAGGRYTCQNMGCGTIFRLAP
jgi:uncharacterized repeat protein (TIGR03803 family)